MGTTGGGGTVLSQVVRESLMGLSQGSQTLKGGRECQADVSGKDVPGKRTSRCKGPGVGTCLLYSEKSQKASVAGVGGGDGRKKPAK